MKPMREWNGLDWFAFVYLLFVGLVWIANVVVHLIVPW